MSQNPEKHYLPASVLFADAMRHNPNALVSQFPFHSEDALAERISWHCAYHCDDPRYRTASFKERSDAGDLLGAGIADHHVVLRQFLTDMPDHECATRYIMNRETFTTIAKLALVGNTGQLRYLIHTNGDERHYGLSSDKTHLEYRSREQNESGKHCPFAGNEDGAKPRPLFQRFHTWSGELLIAELLRDGILH